MALTYNAFATNTLSSTATSITFSGIAGTYTDLRIAMSLRLAASDNVYFRLNGDTAGNYQELGLDTRGGSAQDYSATTQSFINLTGFSGNWPDPLFIDMVIPNYAGSNRKTLLYRSLLADTSSGSMGYEMASWNNTNAITSITIATQSAVNFLAGTSVTLYGISRF